MADFHELQGELEHLEEQLKQANEEINRRARRPLLPAILTGLLLGALVIVGVLIPIVFVVFATAMAALGAFELASALRASGRRVPRVPLVVLTVLIVAASYWAGPWWHWLCFLAAAVVLAVWRLVEACVPALRGGARVVGADVAAGVLTLGYVAYFASFTTRLIAEPDGQWWLLAGLIVVVAIDTGAYAFGLTLGRHPMAPRISPKKSWEGFAGGALVALVAGVLVAWLMIGTDWWLGLVIGGVLLLTGTLGDLTESLIKRDLAVKDMSGWLPGHGGILDRIDSILLSAPAIYALYLLFHA